MNAAELAGKAAAELSSGAYLAAQTTALVAIAAALVERMGQK